MTTLLCLIYLVAALIECAHTAKDEDPGIVVPVICGLLWWAILGMNIYMHFKKDMNGGAS